MILINDNTELEDIALADLVEANIGTLNLEAEGVFNADNMLVADKVELEDDISDNNEYQGTITSIADGAGTKLRYADDSCRHRQHGHHH